MLVCISGTDGSGKSTQVEKLRKVLAKKYKCTSLRLYETKISPSMQKKAVYYLKHNNIECKRYNVMISYMMHEIKEKSYPKLINALKDNEIVIIDRYLETIDFIVENYSVDEKILDTVIRNMPIPDVYLYLKVNPKVSYLRITKVREPGEGETLEEITQAANYYEANAERLGLTIIDGEKSQNEILNDCIKIINDKFAEILV